MGVVDWISNAVKVVKDKTTKIFTNVKDAMVGIASKVKDIAETTYGVVKSGVKAGYEDVRTVVGFVGKQIDKTTSGISNLIGSPFTMIALAIGGLVALRAIK